MDLWRPSAMLQDRTDSNIQDLLLLSQPECEANQARLGLKPAAKQAPVSAGGQH